MKKVLILLVCITFCYIAEAGLIVFPTPIRYYMVEEKTIGFSPDLDLINEDKDVSDRGYFVDLYINDESVYFFDTSKEQITYKYQKEDEKGGKIYSRTDFYYGNVKAYKQIIIYKDGTMVMMFQIDRGPVTINYYKRKK